MNKLENVVEITQQKLGENYKVFIQKSIKNNDVELAGVAIEREGDNIIPMFYVTDEEMDVCGVVAVADRIVEQYKSDKSVAKFDTKQIFTREYLLNNVEPKAIGYEANKVSLRANPHRRVADIAGIYIVVASDENGEIGSYTITHDIMEMFNLNIQEIDAAAKKNYFEKRQIQLIDIMQEVQELQYGKLLESTTIDEVDISVGNMYVLRDSRGVNGACNNVTGRSNIHGKIKNDTEKYRFKL